MALSRGQYEVYYFDNQSAFLERLTQMTPHLVILSLKSLTMPLNDIVEKINQISLEIRFIFLSADDNFNILSEYADYGVVDILSETAPQLDNRVLWSADRACEKIYLEYQNEQLFNKLKEAQQQKSSVVAEPPKVEPIMPLISYKEFISDLRSAHSKEELIATMLRECRETPLVYLRYLPSMASFLVTDTTFIPAENFKNLGCRLNPEENKDLARQLELALVPPSLGELLSEAFKMQNPRLRPLMSGAVLEGVLVGDASTPEANHSLNERFAILSLVYSHFTLERRVESAEIMDSSTEIYNEKYYRKKLEEELQRARRSKQALCVLKLGLDDYADIEKSLGEPAKDLIFKNLAALIQKSSRAHDIACRTDENEISIILPNCRKAEAEVRAERLRRTVETNALINNGLKITISLGACEFPSMCSNAQKLDEGAHRSLQFIMGKGGNKVCFFKAPTDHKPEFVPAQGAKA